MSTRLTSLVITWWMIFILSWFMTNNSYFEKFHHPLCLGKICGGQHKVCDTLTIWAWSGVGFDVGWSSGPITGLSPPIVKMVLQPGLLNSCGLGVGQTTATKKTIIGSQHIRVWWINKSNIWASDRCECPRFYTSKRSSKLILQPCIWGLSKAANARALDHHWPRGHVTRHVRPEQPGQWHVSPLWHCSIFVATGNRGYESNVDGWHVTMLDSRYKLLSCRNFIKPQISQ